MIEHKYNANEREQPLKIRKEQIVITLTNIKLTIKMARADVNSFLKVFGQLLVPFELLPASPQYSLQQNQESKY